MFTRLRLGTKVDFADPTVKGYVPDPDEGFPVFIQAKEMFQHLMVIGKTGAGKSVFLLNWLVTLFLSRVAVILIEPSGFLARDFYSATRGKAAICSLKNPAPINPMLLPYPAEIISSIIRESINQVIALVTDGANKFLTAKMNVILDKVIVDCVNNGATSLTDVLNELIRLRGDNETRDGIIARLSFLLADQRMREILCGPGTLDIATMSDKGQSFIMDCSGMSQEQMVFVGNIISQSIKSHLRFADHTKLHPLALIIDECHNFISPNWTTILKEGRKYQLSAMLATQDLAFFTEQVRRVILNIGSIVSFRLGANEASHIARELHIRPEVLQFLEKYHVAYLTPSGRGFAKAPYPPFLKKFPVPTAAVTPQAMAPTQTPTPTKPSTPPTINQSPVINIPMIEIKWFPLVPYPHETLNSGEASVEAHAETGRPSNGGTTP